MPAPLVALNRWTIVALVVLAMVSRAPVLTTVLFAIVAAAACFGRNGSVVAAIGSRVLGPATASARARGDVEDPALGRFNNALAAVMLGAAQIAFLAHAPLAGWLLSLATALAAAVALAGYCVGCTLFYRFKAWRFRFAGR